jgi:hypothetical protein
MLVHNIKAVTSGFSRLSEAADNRKLIAGRSFKKVAVAQ